MREALLRHGGEPGIHVRDGKVEKYWRANGMKFWSCNSEVGYLLEKVQETVAALRV